MAHMNMAMGAICKHRNVTPKEFSDRFAFTCNACRELGYGRCYTCINGCDFHLHEECLTASTVALHPFFEQRSFSLQLQHSPNTTDFCTACGLTVKGLRYYHTLQRGENIYLHPCCMKLPRRIETNDGNNLFLKKKLESHPCCYPNCSSPGDHLDWWMYVSADDQNLGCHVSCMKEIAHQNWKLNFYGSSSSDPCIGSRSLSGPLILRQRHYQNHYAGQQQHMPGGILGILTRAIFSLFFHFAVGELISGVTTIGAFNELLWNDLAI